MTKEELKLVLEALELSAVTVDSFGVQKKTNEAITAIKEALAQTELCKYGQEPKSCTSNPMDCQCAIEEALAQTQEPWCMKMNGCKTKCEDCPDEPPQRTEQEPVAWYHAEDYKTHFTTIPSPDLIGKYWKPLYTHPPQRTWVGLTRMELIKCGVLPFGMSYDLYQAIEAKLKELNT